MKKNLIKKLVIGGLITSFYICFCFINVNASVLDDYSPTNGTQTLPLKTWDDINEPNDLLGVTLLFNDNPKSVGLPFSAEEGSYFEIHYRFNDREYELESYPIVWGLNSNHVLYADEIINSSLILRIEEEYGGADDPISIFTRTNNSTGLLLQTAGDYEEDSTQIAIYYNNWTYGPRLISFPLDQRDPTSVQLELFVDGNNWSSQFSSPWQALYAFLRRNTTIIYSSQMASDLLTLSEIEAWNEGYNVGYRAGYDDGYYQGGIDSGNDNFRFTFLTGIFNAVSDVLNLEIFPNIKLSYFVFVPLALGITGMIFWFWRKD